MSTTRLRHFAISDPIECRWNGTSLVSIPWGLFLSRDHLLAMRANQIVVPADLQRTSLAGLLGACNSDSSPGWFLPNSIGLVSTLREADPCPSATGNVMLLLCHSYFDVVNLWYLHDAYRNLVPTLQYRDWSRIAYHDLTMFLMGPITPGRLTQSISSRYSNRSLTNSEMRILKPSLDCSSTFQRVSVKHVARALVKAGSVPTAVINAS